MPNRAAVMQLYTSEQQTEQQLLLKLENISQEFVDIPFNDRTDWGKTVTCTVPRCEDLLGWVFLSIRLPPLVKAPDQPIYRYCNRIGHVVIKEAQLRVGGQIVERREGIMMRVLQSSKLTASEKPLWDSMTGYSEHAYFSLHEPQPAMALYVPLDFFFTGDPSRFLPLIALGLTNVSIVVKLRDFSKCVFVDDEARPQPPQPQPLQCSVVAEYIHLSEAQRADVAARAYRFPFDQWQGPIVYDVSESVLSSKFRLDFANPMKVVVFFLTEHKSLANNDFFYFSRRVATRDPLITHALLLVDGKERISKTDETFLRTVEPLGKFTPSNPHVYSMAFALDPASRDTSGGYLNFSRFDNIELQLHFGPSVLGCQLNVVGVCHNVFVIENGFGYVLFAD
ncbi:hypothetical protein HK102_001011 [Quaeritorhiza haematococci]|nr:hypothetical protein HK102_001011 [Quaeritorhiza haematococci]